jgi:hypothetical protein
MVLKASARMPISSLVVAVACTDKSPPAIWLATWIPYMALVAAWHSVTTERGPKVKPLRVFPYERRLI